MRSAPLIIRERRSTDNNATKIIHETFMWLLDTQSLWRGYWSISTPERTYRLDRLLPTIMNVSLVDYPEQELVNAISALLLVQRANYAIGLIVTSFVPWFRYSYNLAASLTFLSYDIALTLGREVNLNFVQVTWSNFVGNLYLEVKNWTLPQRNCRIQVIIVSGGLSRKLRTCAFDTMA